MPVPDKADYENTSVYLNKKVKAKLHKMRGLAPLSAFINQILKDYVKGKK